MTVYGLLLNLYCANGTDAENYALAFSENGIHKRTVALNVRGGNEALYSSRKSAAVNTPSGFLAGEVALSQTKSERKSLLGEIFGGIYVLQIAE